ncbi:MAG: type 1 glutamine amidotransferase [Patescibacteria group bacterium]|nr:type 1 glutamine amidotransferase [Patescibacteria group bacterium]
MNIHFLQHVPFEDSANVGAWARDRGHTVTCTRMDEAEPLPPMDAFDWLVVLGGPMNVDEHEAYPWLVAEKQFLAEAIQRKKHVLGICLGAQLAAEVLGGRVTPNPHKEIGWFPVELTDAGLASPGFADFAERFLAFHWHGDTFSIPPGADRLAESPACPNQAFQYAGHVLGLQFHLDYSVASIEKMLHHCRDELVDGPYIQTADALRASFHHAAAIQAHLVRLLDNLQRHWNA